MSQTMMPAPGQDQIDAWGVRLRGAAYRAGAYVAGPLFVVFMVVALFLGGQDRYDPATMGELLSYDAETGTTRAFEPEMQSTASVLFGKFIAAAGSAGGVSVLVAFAVFQVGWKAQRDARRLQREGEVVGATVVKIGVYGGSFMRSTVGGLLGVLWEPVAPLLASKIPVMSVSLQIDRADGRVEYVGELLFADEAAALGGLGEGDRVAMLLDPESAVKRHWMVRPVEVVAVEPLKAAA